MSTIPTANQVRDIGLFLNLGMLTLVWSILEQQMSYAIGRLSGMDRVNAHLVTDRMNASRKIDLIRVLVELRGPEAVAKLAPTAEKLLAATTLRNHLVHGHFIGEVAEPARILIKWSTAGKITKKELKLTRDEANRALRLVVEASELLDGFLAGQGLPYPNTPDTQEPQSSNEAEPNRPARARQPKPRTRKHPPRSSEA